MSDRTAIERGTVFNVQRFSLHDGPGIRTVVFLKGCPLRCKWCSNPESWGRYPEIMFDPGKCLPGCSRCVAACPADALVAGEGAIKLSRVACDRCSKCVEVCPAEALTRVGSDVAVEQLMVEIEKDSLFYRNSGGGVTASGGEPLAQPEFVRSVFQACKGAGISTALETSGCAPRETLDRVLEYTDLILFDVKHTDPKVHRESTGMSNEMILGNALFAFSRVRTWLRFPLIPGYNDSEDNLVGIARFAANSAVEKLSLLPYHSWGKSKYRRIGRRYALSRLRPPDDAQIERAKSILEKSGKEVTIGW
ncbi:MAG: glycyl-radical enzyme activating protein [Chloroflexi bacterium]|nr:glycyl-radical enzyme activating protein [Chloroflexota bacterium]